MAPPNLFVQHCGQSVAANKIVKHQSRYGLSVSKLIRSRGSVDALIVQRASKPSIDHVLVL